jgi:hypothetical protein
MISNKEEGDHSKKMGKNNNNNEWIQELMTRGVSEQGEDQQA